jgi:hypothetical protein
MERVFSTIPAVLSATATDDATAEAFVLAAWKNVAGEVLNKRTRAIGVSGKKLTIAVADAVWQRNLEDLAPGFIARLNRIAGDRAVTFIEFVVDPAAVRSSHRSEPASPNFALDASLVEAANAITHEGLRENFLATAADYLARQTRR